MKFKLLAIAALAFPLAGCLGDQSVDNELIGQVKKVQHVTPLLFPEYNRADVSLGIVQNGTGSMSQEDIWFWVQKDTDLAKLKEASETGAIVKIKYNSARIRLYGPEPYVVSVETRK